MPTTPEPPEDREPPEHFGDLEPSRRRAPRLPTADQCQEMFHQAPSAGDVKGAEAAMRLMAVVDPHRAQDLLDITKVALKAASDPRLRQILLAALQTEEPADPAPQEPTDKGIADKVRDGGQPAVDVAVDLAAGLLQIAKMAMPDIYYRMDSRCQAARSLLTSAGEDAE